MTAALEGDEWSAAHLGRTLPPGKTQYPFYRRLAGPQGRSGWVKNLVPTGIRSRTIQHVAQSLYRLSYLAHTHTHTHTHTHIYIYMRHLTFFLVSFFKLNVLLRIVFISPAYEIQYLLLVYDDQN